MLVRGYQILLYAGILFGIILGYYYGSTNYSVGSFKGSLFGFLISLAVFGHLITTTKILESLERIEKILKKENPKEELLADKIAEEELKIDNDESDDFFSKIGQKGSGISR